MAKYLITGGNGYLAQPIINLLLQSGNFVRAIDFNFELLNLEDDFNSSIECLCFSLDDHQALNDAFKDIDLCIHLASPYRAFTDYKTQSTAILEGLNVFHAAIESNNVPVVFSSTDSVYGPNISDLLFESAQKMPIDPMGAHKLSLEHHARVLGLTHGLNSTSMRLFNVYGIWRNNWKFDVVSQFCQSALLNKEIVVHGTGEQTRDFIHVSDVARAFILASENTHLGFETYNVCTGQSTSINTLIEMISSLLGYRLSVRYENKRVGDLYCAVGSNSKINKDLNFMPRVSMSDGLRRVLEEAGAITLQKVI